MAPNRASPQVPRPGRAWEEPVTAAAFEAEIRQALRFERGLAVKALFSLALVAAALAAHVIFFT